MGDFYTNTHYMYCIETYRSLKLRATKLCGVEAGVGFIWPYLTYRSTLHSERVVSSSIQLDPVNCAHLDRNKACSGEIRFQSRAIGVTFHRSTLSRLIWVPLGSSTFTGRVAPDVDVLFPSSKLVAGNEPCVMSFWNRAVVREQFIFTYYA